MEVFIDMHTSVPPSACVNVNVLTIRQPHEKHSTSYVRGGLNSQIASSSVHSLPNIFRVSRNLVPAPTGPSVNSSNFVIAEICVAGG